MTHLSPPFRIMLANLGHSFLLIALGTAVYTLIAALIGVLIDIEKFTTLRNGVSGKWVALIGQPTAAEFELGFAEMLPDGIKGKGKRTGFGYQMEFAVPISVLENIRRGKLTDMRFNVTVLDRDKDNKTKEYSWGPGWNEGYVGSGTFFRQ